MFFRVAVEKDELEDFEDMFKRFLEGLAKKAREEQERIVQAAAEVSRMRGGRLNGT